MTRVIVTPTDLKARQDVYICESAKVEGIFLMLTNVREQNAVPMDPSVNSNVYINSSEFRMVEMIERGNYGW